jgi:hypothetical protein
MQAYAEELPAGCFFIVGFDDDQRYLKVDPAMPLRISMAGRKDRGDKADMEPCVHLPITHFRRLDA